MLQLQLSIIMVNTRVWFLKCKISSFQFRFHVSFRSMKRPNELNLAPNCNHDILIEYTLSCWHNNNMRKHFYIKNVHLVDAETHLIRFNSIQFNSSRTKAHTCTTVISVNQCKYKLDFIYKNSHSCATNKSLLVIVVLKFE